MLHQNSDLHMLYELFLQILNRLAAERETRSQQFEFLSQRISNMEEREKERLERLESLESEIPYLRHRVDRTIELECLENRYSLDGDAYCNFSEVRNNDRPNFAEEVYGESVPPND